MRHILTRFILLIGICCFLFNVSNAQPHFEKPPGFDMSVDELIENIADPALGGQLKYRYLTKMSGPGDPPKEEILSKLKVALSKAEKPKRIAALNAALGFGVFNYDYKRYEEYVKYYQDAMSAYDEWPEEQYELKKSIIRDLLLVGAQKYGHVAFYYHYIDLLDDYTHDEPWLPEKFLERIRGCALRYPYRDDEIKEYLANTANEFADDHVILRRLGDVALACTLYEDSQKLYKQVLKTRLSDEERVEVQSSLLAAYAEAEQWEEVNKATDEFLEQMTKQQELKKALSEKYHGGTASFDELKTGIALTTSTPTTDGWTESDLRDWLNTPTDTSKVYTGAMLAYCKTMTPPTKLVYLEGDREKDSKRKMFDAGKELDKVFPLFLESDPDNLDRAIVGLEMLITRRYENVLELLKPLPDSMQDSMTEEERACVYAKWIISDVATAKLKKDSSAFRENIKKDFNKALPWSRQFEWFVPFYSRADQIVRLGFR